MAIKIPHESAKQTASFLLSLGVISSLQFDQAKAASEEGGGDLIELLIDFGFVSEEKISQSLSEAYNIERISLTGIASIQEQALSLLPTSFILENRIIPFAVENGVLNIALSEPETFAIISSVSVITEHELVAKIINISEMGSLLSKIVEKNNSDADNQLIDDKMMEHSLSSKKHTSKAAKKEIKKDSDSSQTIDFVDQMLKAAVQQGVSDVHIEPYKKYSRVRFRMDGVLHDQPKFNKLLTANYAAVVTRVKIMSTLDIAERRLPQDGAVSVEVDGKGVDLRVSILPTKFGERVVMRILDRSAISLSIETLGFLESDEKAFKSAIDSPQGMVLVTGPTGSGKSTTLYSALGRVNRNDVNILTAEDPVEYEVAGVGQVQIKDDIGLTFSAALRSFLRQDPEIILVGEIRDKETADIAIKSALTGHLVLSTLHTNDAVSTITRLINMGVPSYLIASSLTLVVAQRLARKICQHCKVIDDKQPEAKLISVGFTAEESSIAHLYRGAGCQECNHTGYKGRQGIYEVLQVDEEMRQGILNELTTAELLKLAKKQGKFSTMQEIGKGMLIQGTITMEEYQRVLVLD